MVAKNAKTELKGTALTIVTCIGFAITIVSIQLISFLVELVSFKYLYLILVIGPGLGVFALFKK